MITHRRGSLVALTILCWLSGAVRADDSGGPAEWPYTEGAPGGGRYSPLDEINRENVSRLRSCGPIATATSSTAAGCRRRRSAAASFESTPIVVDGRLFFTTPIHRVIALDPETGASCGPSTRARPRPRSATSLINRGVAYWRDGGEAEAPARARLPRHARRAAVRARRGDRKAMPRLRRGRQRRSARRHRAAGRRLGVQRDLAADSRRRRRHRRLLDRRHVCAASARRATCAASTRARGRALWTFHTIPHPARPATRPGKERQRRTRRRERVVDDHRRPRARARLPAGGDGRAPTSTAATGPARTCTRTRSSRSKPRRAKRVWHYQTVHHDLWDYDLAAPPALVRVSHGGGAVDAVAQATKSRLRLPPRPRHGHAALSGRGAAGAGERRAGRARLADAADPHQAAAARAAALEARPISGTLDPDRLGECRDMPARASQRGHVHAAERARHGGVPVHRRWRELVGLGFDPRSGLALRAGQQPRPRRHA